MSKMEDDIIERGAVFLISTFNYFSQSMFLNSLQQCFMLQCVFFLIENIGRKNA